MFSMLKNLTKAAVSVAVAPVALVVDIATLPSSANYNTDPFERTKKLLNGAGDSFNEAVKTERD